MKKLFKRNKTNTLKNYNLKKLKPSKNKYKVRQENVFIFIDDMDEWEDEDDIYYLGYRPEYEFDEYEDDYLN